MKPKNKFQQQVVNAINKLPRITKEQIQWGYRNCIQHIGRKTKKGVITCTACGHEWIDTKAKKNCTCPHCAIKLKIENTLKRTFYDYEYLCIITTCEGLQVLRFLYIECNMKVGKKASYSHTEAVQRWLAPDGKNATVARLRPMGYFIHGWSYSSHLELRTDNDNRYGIIPTLVYPKQQIIPQLKKCGYKKHLHGMNPFPLFRNLLSDNRMEILFKTGQKPLFKQFFKEGTRKMDKYWTAIRICIRNRYTIKDVLMWFDYIDLLIHFGKDLHNAHYVCPLDINKEHDILMNRKSRQEAREEKEKNFKKFLENEPIYKQAKGHFFGLQFSDGSIRVRVLESVEEIMIEGKALHHCVYTNDYYLKDDSLILSATTEDGYRLETVEISLSRMEVIQCRGLCNKTTKYHNKILKLVKRNFPQIAQRLTA